MNPLLPSPQPANLAAVVIDTRRAAGRAAALHLLDLLARPGRHRPIAAAIRRPHDAR